MTEEKVKKTMKRSADLIAIREEKVKGTEKRLPDFARIRKRIGNGDKCLRFYDGYEAGEVDESLRVDNVYRLAHTKARIPRKEWDQLERTSFLKDGGTTLKKKNGMGNTLKRHYETYLVEYEYAHDDVDSECSLLCRRIMRKRMDSNVYPNGSVSNYRNKSQKTSNGLLVS
ncbi:unnamed protein product [Brassica napus]|uniref:(rape) hypothetical protein n=1 Tax=Brassica napus TaxID=3708 RepID=A0A816III0_BRANA|nr:unnamed protein product [Brassica napus]